MQPTGQCTVYGSPKSPYRAPIRLVASSVTHLLKDRSRSASTSPRLCSSPDQHLKNLSRNPVASLDRRRVHSYFPHKIQGTRPKTFKIEKLSKQVCMYSATS